MCSSELVTMDGPVYLVVLKQAIVSQDIASIIAEHDATAQIILAFSLVEAEAALAMVDQIAVAFLDVSAARFAYSVLHKRIEALGGKIVLTGSETDEQDVTGAWDVLQQPFTTESALAVLRKIDMDEIVP